MTDADRIASGERVVFARPSEVTLVRCGHVVAFAKGDVWRCLVCPECGVAARGATVSPKKALV